MIDWLCLQAPEGGAAREGTFVPASLLIFPLFRYEMIIYALEF